MPADRFQTADVVVVLNTMMLERKIVGYRTNFDEVRRYGFPAKVHVWIRAQDELSLARVRRRVREVLIPLLPQGGVTVTSEALPAFSDDQE